MLQIDRKLAAHPAHRGWCVSLFVHAAAAAAIFSVAIPMRIERPYRATPVYLPVLPPTAPRPLAMPHRHAKTLPTPASTPAPRRAVIPAAAPATRAMELPRSEAPAAIPTPMPAIIAPPLALPEASAPRRIELQTGRFESHATGASAPETPAKLQSAGFDAAANVAAKPTRTASPSTAAAFGDSAPAEPSQNPRRSVPSTQFGSASGNGRDRTPKPQAVASTQFDAIAAAPTERHAAPGAAVREPIEILAKPKPVYTEEARRLRIQGEVVLEVLFRASAQVCVLRVVRGLGHGLDASAEQAALGIRFHPAAEAGRAIDSVATVKIEFQLAD
jgi:TonB family protein